MQILGLVAGSARERRVEGRGGVEAAARLLAPPTAPVSSAAGWSDAPPAVSADAPENALSSPPATAGSRVTWLPVPPTSGRRLPLDVLSNPPAPFGVASHGEPSGLRRARSSRTRRSDATRGRVLPPASAFILGRLRVGRSPWRRSASPDPGLSVSGLTIASVRERLTACRFGVGRRSRVGSVAEMVGDVADVFVAAYHLLRLDRPVRRERVRCRDTTHHAAKYHVSRGLQGERSVEAHLSPGNRALSPQEARTMAQAGGRTESRRKPVDRHHQHPGLDMLDPAESS